MNKSHIVLSFIVFFILNCINAFSESGGIGSANFYEYNVKFIEQMNIDNLTDNDSANTIENNLGNIGNNSSRRDIITNTNVNVISDNSQWLERIVVNDYTPDAGDTITIEGFGWNPNNYSDGVEITLSGGGTSDLRVGKIIPDNNGYFKIKYKLPKSYKYNDIIEVRCNGEVVALLQIKD